MTEAQAVEMLAKLDSLTEYADQFFRGLVTLQFLGGVGIGMALMFALFAYVRRGAL